MIKTLFETFPLFTPIMFSSLLQLVLLWYRLSVSRVDAGDLAGQASVDEDLVHEF